MNKVTEINIGANAQPEIAANTAPKAQTAVKRSRKGGRLIILVALLVGGWYFGKPWLLDRWAHVSINDARIATALVTVSSEVRGRINAVPVITGDSVKQGAPLVLIDAEQAQLAVTGAKARLESIEAKHHQLQTQQAMIRTQITSRHMAAETRITTARANHEGSLVALRNAQSQFNRINELVERNIASAQKYETALAELDIVRQRERAAAAEILTAQANIAVIDADAAQIDVIDGQIAVLVSEQTGLEAAHAQTLLDIELRTISAAFDGVVDATFVDVGEYVTPGTRLLIYHQPDRVWVNANVKETDFRRIALGAPAMITVDAYPGREFSGKVERLGGAATSQFALLPSPNPSGNFTKVTQRLPIRVSIEPNGATLSPGMMVELSIDVTD
ncbi:MAG: HlyD family secretion protein [Rhodobacteraceae bacterium]|nr:HlyD family secretion protein [Paracoccaceae bacterium]